LKIYEKTLIEFFDGLTVPSQKAIVVAEFETADLTKLANQLLAIGKMKNLAQTFEAVKSRDTGKS